MAPSSPTSRLAGRRVQLMATCLCDAIYADVAQATVEVLEAAGCDVLFPPAQTCCGQPAFNSGDWNSARRVGLHTMEVFAGHLPVIVPSASCAAMVKHGFALAFEGRPEMPRVHDLAHRTWELAEFLVEGLGLQSWSGSYPRTLAFHRSCHSRGSTAGESARQLLQSIDGVRLVDQDEQEQCCGFGGTFSVSFPHISAAMGQTKLAAVARVAPDELVGGDMSCLMHLGGLAEKQGQPLRYRHLAQVLRDARAALPVAGTGGRHG